MAQPQIKIEDDFHDDFPPEAKEMWDIVAKALLLRLGEGITVLSKEELRRAARSKALIDLHGNGDLEFFIKKAGRDTN